MRINRRLAWLAAAGISVAALLAPQLLAQSLLDGYWNPLGHQDSHNYGGGPDPGEFPGLPITDAARKVASNYDENEMMLR